MHTLSHMSHDAPKKQHAIQHNTRAVTGPAGAHPGTQATAHNDAKSHHFKSRHKQ